MIKKFDEFLKSKMNESAGIVPSTSIPGVEYGHVFTDMNGTKHINGFFIPTAKPKILANLVSSLISERGNECDLNDIDVSNFKELCYDGKWHVTGIFEKSEFDGDISGWDVSNVVNMCSLFFDCRNFNSDISQWNVHNVKNMDCMFFNCWDFDFHKIDGWDIRNVDFEDDSHVFGDIEEDESLAGNLPKWYTPVK